MTDGEAKRVLLEVLSLVPGDVEAIDIVVRPRGKVGEVRISVLPLMRAVEAAREWMRSPNNRAEDGTRWPEPEVLDDGKAKP